jgi:GNAT superfamily N-acetyltransferase
VGEQPAGLTEDRAPRPSRVAERRPVHIRPASARDAAAVRLLIAGLTPLSQHRRFFAGVCPPSAMLVRALTQPGSGRDVLLALCGDQVVGHAIGVHGAAGAFEIGVVVGDAWQGQGVGTHLVRLLLRRAVPHGAHTVIMDIQAENRRVLRAVRRAFPDGVTRRDVAVLTFQSPIRRSRQRPELTTPLRPEMTTDERTLVGGQSADRPGGPR